MIYALCAMMCKACVIGLQFSRRAEIQILKPEGMQMVAIVLVNWVISRESPCGILGNYDACGRSALADVTGRPERECLVFVACCRGASRFSKR